MRTHRTNILQPAKIETKIKTLQSLKLLVAQLRKKSLRIVFTNGCFDILHYGHVKYLQDAKDKGDLLIVGVNSDNSIRKIKGKTRPIVNQSDRMRTLAALASVDFVVLFNENTPLKLIQALKPDVLVKGSDWNKKNIVGAEIVLKNGGKVATVKLAPGRSTTNLINKILVKKC